MSRTFKSLGAIEIRPDGLSGAVGFGPGRRAGPEQAEGASGAGPVESKRSLGGLAGSRGRGSRRAAAGWDIEQLIGSTS